MAIRTISTRMAIEGEAQYKQASSACNAELKTLKSSLAEGQDAELEALAEALASGKAASTPVEEPASEGKKWVCKICGYVYEGESLPEDYVCPICRRPASDFEPVN